MKIVCKWFEGERPQFNLNLASADGKEPFLEVKGCRIVDGSKGAFVSWPATKNQATGKYWNHVYASEAFNLAVLAEAQKTMPVRDTRTHGERKAGRPVAYDDGDDGPPF